MTFRRTTSTAMLAAVALAFGGSGAFADDITIGFVAHAQGDPFVQQIQDGAQAAAEALAQLPAENLAALRVLCSHVHRCAPGSEVCVVSHLHC